LHYFRGLIYRRRVAELKQLKREIGLASALIHAILRNADLSLMLPPEVKEEFERFCEVY
jgi:hypothetical protein